MTSLDKLKQLSHRGSVDIAHEEQVGKQKEEGKNWHSPETIRTISILYLI